MSDNEQTVRRVLELYVDQMQGTAEMLDELLLVRLRFFGEDIQTVIRRLTEDPDLAVTLVHNLSTVMQQLDTDAGRADQAHGTVSAARRWALILPETGIHNGDEGGEQ